MQTRSRIVALLLFDEVELLDVAAPLSVLSQAGRHWFDEELFLGLMRMRGVECRSPSGYAEGFDARKWVLG